MSHYLFTMIAYKRLGTAHSLEVHSGVGACLLANALYQATELLCHLTACTIQLEIGAHRTLAVEITNCHTECRVGRRR
ncbi:MAG: hypothetical protein WBZ57_04150, partial [Pseudomonas graminis]